ncbi:MAG: hypothetical protein EOM50_03480 [Erysipelotrichia bacterium]|nr:hypothetical protein [Erysipelotrichia bacterium]NCC54075.1 hypothetical protein [Erysipelotrichia bacterium]
MKKIIIFLLCLMMFGVSGCSETVEEFDVKESYTVEDTVKLSLKSMTFGTELEPTNVNGEYYYWYTEDKGTSIVDVQFYVENLTDKEVNLKKYLNAKMIVDEEELSMDYCMETSHFTKIEKYNKLDAKKKSIVHLMYYIKDDVLKKALKKDNQKPLYLEVTLGEDVYQLAVKERVAKVKSLSLNQTIKDERIDFSVYSASASKLIPPLNLNEAASYYQVEDENNIYVGMYMKITNKSDEAIDLNNEICVSAQGDGVTTYTWIDVLNEDQADFSDSTMIDAHATRYVLFFGEREDVQKDMEYTMNILVSGTPYKYTFTRNYIG